MTNDHHNADDIAALQDQLEAKFHQLQRTANERESLALQLQLGVIREQLDRMTAQHYRFTATPWSPPMATTTSTEANQ